MLDRVATNLLPGGGERREHGVDVLVLQDGRTDRVVGRREPLQEPADAVEVVGAVAHLACAALEPAGKRDDRPRCDRVADERLGGLAGAAEHDLPGRHEGREGVVRQHHYRVVIMDNGELLLRDLLQRVAEHVGVLEPHVREQDDARAQDVGGVVPAAEAGLDDGGVDSGLGECRERSGGEHFELGGGDLLGSGAHTAQRLLQVRLAPVDPDPLRRRSARAGRSSPRS